MLVDSCVLAIAESITDVCRGNYKDAVNSYKAATDITEDNPQAFMRLGNCLFSLDRYTEAESAFRRGLEVSLNPPSPFCLPPISNYTFPWSLRESSSAHVSAECLGCERL